MTVNRASARYEGFGKEGPLGCVSCHSEHEGPVRQPAGTEAFCGDFRSPMMIGSGAGW